MKKLNKFFAVLVALAMMAVLSVTAFAAETDPAVTDATHQSPSADKAYVVKYLKIKEGVTIPGDDTFQFTFTPVETDTIKTADYTMTPAWSFQVKQMHLSDSTKDGGALVYSATVESLFGEQTFPKAGEYKWTVKEKAMTKTGENANQTSTGTYVTDTEEYTLRVYVINDGDSTKIDKVTVTGEEPGDNEGETEKVKKDITVQDPSDGGDEDDTNDLTQDDIKSKDVEGFTFVNEYKQADNEVPVVNPENGQYGAFNTTKTVEGTYGDKTAEFPFTVKVTFPSEYIGKKELTLYKIETGKPLVTPATEDAEEVVNYAPLATLELKQTKDGDTVTAEWYEATYNLAPGYTAFFENLPDEASVTVSENLATRGDAQKIQNKNEYVQKSETKIDTVIENGTVTKNPATQETRAAEDFDATALVYKDANAAKRNATDFTNTSTYDPGNTGILLSNLPYIVLALVAIGGMVAYVVIRRRQSDEA